MDGLRGMPPRFGVILAFAAIEELVSCLDHDSGDSPSRADIGGYKPITARLRCLQQRQVLPDWFAQDLRLLTTVRNRCAHALVGFEADLDAPTVIPEITLYSRETLVRAIEALLPDSVTSALGPHMDEVLDAELRLVIADDRLLLRVPRFLDSDLRPLNRVCQIMLYQIAYLACHLIKVGTSANQCQENGEQ
jgi:hypothetical protein